MNKNGTVAESMPENILVLRSAGREQAPALQVFMTDA